MSLGMDFLLWESEDIYEEPATPRFIRRGGARRPMNDESLGSEFLADHAFELDYPFGLPGSVWTMKDGEKIKLSDMTTTHILHCMNLVGEDDGWYAEFQKELERRVPA